ncbi:unnamed protein product, partial [Symbiodinium sp. CCMP2592]
AGAARAVPQTQIQPHRWGNAAPRLETDYLENRGPPPPSPGNELMEDQPPVTVSRPNLHPTVDIFEDDEEQIFASANSTPSMPEGAQAGETPAGDAAPSGDVAPPSPLGPPSSLTEAQKRRLQNLLQQRDEHGRAPYNLDDYTNARQVEGIPGRLQEGIPRLPPRPAQQKSVGA